MTDTMSRATWAGRVAAIALTTTLAACLVEPDELALGDTDLEITTADCTRLGDPYAGCAAFTPTRDACKGPWNSDRGGWVDGRPICLGFSTDLDNCSNCNRLKIDPYDKCKNRNFIKCGEAGLLPGQGSAADMCFVTDPADLTAPTSWPAGDGQATAREMCALGVPTAAAVKDCRTKAKCKTTAAAVPVALD